MGCLFGPENSYGDQVNCENVTVLLGKLVKDEGLCSGISELSTSRLDIIVVFYFYKSEYESIMGQTIKLFRNLLEMRLSDCFNLICCYRDL